MYRLQIFFHFTAMKGSLGNQECKNPCMAVDSYVIQKYMFSLLYTDREGGRGRGRREGRGIYIERASYSRWTSRNYNTPSIHLSHIPFLFLFVPIQVMMLHVNLIQGYLCMDVLVLFCSIHPSVYAHQDEFTIIILERGGGRREEG